MSVMLLRRLALAALALALLVPASAAAHATMMGPSPGFRERLERAPERVVLRFDQAVKLPSVHVFDSTGRDWAGAVRLEGTKVVAGVGELPKGPYTVRWHVLSADSHVVSGVFTFGVRAKAPPPMEAYGAVGPTRMEHLVRWAYFLALGLLIGSLAFRLLCLRGLALPPRLDRRLHVLSGIGVVAVLEVGILAFCLRCQGVLQLPLGKFLYGDLSPISTDTRFGKAFVAMTLGYAAVAALVYLAWLLDLPRLLVPALALSLAFASGLSLSGHDGGEGGSRTAAVADWVHLSAASIWLGGLVALAVAVWPAAPELRREAFHRFSRVAVALVGLMVAAGVYLSVVRLPRLSDLWTTGYGQVLLVKVGLVLLVLAWGAVHHFAVRPALERAGEGFLARVGRSVLGETAVAAAVLLAAAVLVDSKPPPPPDAPAAQSSSSSSREAYAGAVGSSSWRK
jgi:copper transport protein